LRRLERTPNFIGGGKKSLFSLWTLDSLSSSLKKQIYNPYSTLAIYDSKITKILRKSVYSEEQVEKEV